MKLFFQNLLMLVILLTISSGFYYVYNEAMQKKKTAQYSCYFFAYPKVGYSETEQFSTTRKELESVDISDEYRGYLVTSVDLSRNSVEFVFGSEHNDSLEEKRKSHVTCFKEKK
jgi:hypothetical protein